MGPFDNETGRHVLDENLLSEAHWFLDHEKRQVFIVPLDGEIEGPEGATLDALNALYRSAGSIHQVDYLAIGDRIPGLAWVHPNLRRFDAQCGYFAA